MELQRNHGSLTTPPSPPLVAAMAGALLPRLGLATTVVASSPEPPASHPRHLAYLPPLADHFIHARVRRDDRERSL